MGTPDENNFDEILGEKVRVSEDVIPGKPGGRVEFGCVIWSAVSDEYIPQGKTATITAINGLVLKIKN